MEVTKHNFMEALKEVKELLPETDFISFDSEMSGLGRMLGQKNHDLDTPKERYEKAMKRVSEYGLIQIGISLFRFCSKSKKYLTATYCFFLSGEENKSYRYDSSSMTFLAGNGFDFNKLFLEGLPFLTLAKEADIRKKRADSLLKQGSEDSCSPVKVKDEKAKNFLKEALLKMTESANKCEETLFDGKQMNGFFRKILFNNVAAKFPNSVFQNMHGNERNVKVLHFESEEKKNEYLDSAWEQDLDKKVGFTHVVKAIIEANKPLVGHNIILDILHFVDKFISPLPEDLDAFKSITLENLPVVYDTKLIAKDPPFSAGISNTFLENLFSELTSKYSPPEFDALQGHKSYLISDTGQAHDGGYDAFMTGVCFATMLKHLEGRNWCKKKIMQSSHLKNYENRINFMGSYDIPFIDLARQEVIPNRSFVFYVTCPSSFTALDVRLLFSILKGYKFTWVDDTHLFVIPQDANDIKNVRSLLWDIRGLCPPTVKVMMYNEVQGNAKNRPKQRRGEEDIIRPSSISLKRSSYAEENSSAQNKIETNDTDESSPRNLKRLKSVGSELLSNMTLESPMCEDKKPPIPTNNETSTKAEANTPFAVPDDW